MIYIIDDNRHDQMSQNYSIDFAKELVKYPKTVKWKTSVDEHLIEEIVTKAKCVLIHYSVQENESKDRLIEMLRDSGKIPYCMFSNGMTATTFVGNSITSIKKDRLYKNLISLISFYEHNGKIDLKLLALGTNYDLERAGIIRDKLIGGVLLKHKTSFKYELVFTGGSTEYKELFELVELANEGVSFTDFESKFNKDTTSANDLRLEILRITKVIQNRDE